MAAFATRSPSTFSDANARTRAIAHAPTRTRVTVGGIAPAKHACVACGGAIPDAHGRFLTPAGGHVHQGCKGREPARVGGHPGARVGVGKPLWVRGDNVREKAAALDGAIRSLNADVLGAIVWEDPTKMENDVADLPASSTVRWVRTKEAAVLRERAVGKSSAQVADEVRYGRGWRSFYDDWDDFNNKIQGPTELIGGMSPSDAWDEVERYETRFNRQYDDYGKLGQKASRPKPPTEKQVEAEHETAKGSPIPWGWIVFGLVLVGGAMFLGQARGLFGASGAKAAA